MKTDNLKDLFDELDFDIAEPAKDHEERFRQKIRSKSRKRTKRSGVVSLWLPAMSIAATFAVAFLIFQGAFSNPFNNEHDLANVSPKMKETQNFYASVIQVELENLKNQKNPETEAVIDDALKQMEKLEASYDNLRKDLGKSGQDQRVIYAMITNFQQRIDLLKTVLEKVNTINNLKAQTHENNII